jgi:hypothetical protein
MTKTTTILVILAAVAAAGPVGEYLGIHVNRQFADVRVGNDTIHYLYGQPDQTDQWSSVDTNCVTSETTLQGHDAWLSTIASYRYDRAVSVDTAFELGDTMLVGCRTVVGLSWHPNLYRVPFVPGSWWRSGTAGTWYADFTGDGLQDTMIVAGDTTTVIGTEDVSTPSGVIPGCWKLRSITLQTLYFVTQGYNLVESTCVRNTEWYKDSMGWVKDSSVAAGTDYVDYGGFIVNDRFVQRSWGIIDGWRPAVAEPDGLTLDAERPTLQARPNPCRDRLELVGCGAATLFSADGRRVADLAQGTNDVTRLGPGVYVLRAPGLVPARVVKVE